MHDFPLKCTDIKYLANVMTVLNSSFFQFIEYQDAHVNLLTESTDFILNSVCNFTTFGKELPIVLLSLCSPSIMSICSFSLRLNIGFKF